MKRVVLLVFVLLSFFFVFLLSLVLVGAVGGGGGGGSGGGGSGGSSGGGGSGASRPSFSEVSCDDSGVIQFQMRRIEENLSAVDLNTNETIKLEGDWEGNYYFQSKKRFLVNAGEYSIFSPSTGITRTFSCPGLNQCFYIKIQDVYCKKDEKGTEAGLTLIGDNGSDNLEFTFKKGIKKFRYSKYVQSSEFKDFEIVEDGNSFILIPHSELEFDEFEVVHEKCIGKEYIYSRVECIVRTEPEKEADRINPNELKCGGLLNVRDRVKCRINLPTNSEKEEYENFYPEECRNHKDPDKCIQIYRAVSICWDEIKSEDRFNCLREKIELGDIKKEKSECQTQQCREELNDKILTLIKLRFYNLEEQAEILEEKGLLDQEELIDFVTKIENKKLEFNSVKSKEKMKKIIEDVRTLWENLIKNVRL